MVASPTWRLSFAANAATGSSTVGLTEIEMRATAGGADQCTGGTASASAGTAANGFDNSTGTLWSTSDTSATWIQYAFGSDVEVRELYLSGSSTAAQSPNSFTLQYYHTGLGIFVDAYSTSGLSWTASENKTFAIPMLEHLVDSVTMTEATGQAAVYNWLFEETIRSFAFSEAIRAVNGTLSDTVNISESALPYYGLVIAERLTIELAQVINSNTQVTATDALEMLDALVAGIPVTISETVNITLTQMVQAAVSVMEALEITEVAAGAALYNQTLTETISIADSLANFFGVEISESMTLFDTLGVMTVGSATISETVDITETMGGRLVIRAVVEDSFSIEDTEILNAIYTGTISEAIELAAAYLSPGGSVSTWAMNIKTGAVTEYTNYNFNSFAQLGHKYLGASQDGLYELIGDDDDGTDIVAHIKSGFAQWAGSRFTMFKGVYLGIRGEGDFVLKLTTGDGKEYHYAVNARDQRTTRVKTGKGLRARYWAFELISEGQDFDLDTIEFVPLVAERRV